MSKKENKKIVLEWVKVPSNRNILSCPLCSSKNTSHILNVDHHLSDSGLKVARCNQCRSLFYPEVLASDNVEYYADDIITDRRFIRYNYEIGTGLSFMADVLNSLPKRNFSKYLEIGCGVGVSVDYAKSTFNWQAIGVEPSEYGRQAEKLLGVKVYDDLLENIEEIKGAKFDVIASFEVLEHVYNPVSFLQDIKKRLTKKGMLVLSTPNANFISKKNPQTACYQALFPGEHKILFSPRSLTDALRSVGFSQIKILDRGDGLTAYASEMPFSLNIEDNARYINYLETKLPIFKKEHKPEFLVNAYLFRLFSELVNKGNIERFSPLIDLMLIASRINTEILSSNDQCPYDLTNVEFDDYGEEYPYFLGAGLYYLGMSFLLSGRNKMEAKKLFDWARYVLRKEIEMKEIFYAQSKMLYPLAEFQSKLLDLHFNETTKPEELLDSLFNDFGPATNNINMDIRIFKTAYDHIGIFRLFVYTIKHLKILKRAIVSILHILSTLGIKKSFSKVSSILFANDK